MMAKPQVCFICMMVCLLLALGTTLHMPQPIFFMNANLVLIICQKITGYINHILDCIVTLGCPSIIFEKNFCFKKKIYGHL